MFQRMLCLSTVLLAIVSALMVGTASADVPVRQPGPRVEVRRDPDAKTAKLIVPKKLAAAAGLKVGELPSRTPSIISGLAISGGIALAGLVFLRRRRASGTATVAISAVALVMIAAGGIVFANAPPPPQVREPLSAIAGKVVIGDRPVEIVLEETGDTIVLVLDGAAEAFGAPPVFGPREPGPPRAAPNR